MGNNLPSFVEDVPTYEVRDGRMRIGIGALALVMPIHVFLEGCVRGKAAIAEWQVERLGRVVQFPRR